MTAIVKALIQAEIWIYLLLLLLALIPLRQFIKALRARRNTIFGLEREVAQQKINSSAAVLVLIGLFFVLELILVSVVSVKVPEFSTLSTPTLDILTTPTGTLSAGALEEGVSLTTGPSVVSSEGCIKDQIEWTAPVDGQTVSGEITLRGTVNVPNLGFYKYEYQAVGSEDWITIAAGSQAGVDKELGGVWDTTELTPGDYRLRLVVSDYQNTVFPACIIGIKITQ